MHNYSPFDATHTQNLNMYVLTLITHSHCLTDGLNKQTVSTYTYFNPLQTLGFRIGVRLGRYNWYRRSSVGRSVDGPRTLSADTARKQYCVSTPAWRVQSIKPLRGVKLQLAHVRDIYL